MAINFTINGQPYTVNPKDNPIDQTLNTFIRENSQLTGTKYMCLEGGCGVCVCVIKGRHPIKNEYKIWATNSCLTLLNSCDGWDIITIEGIGNKKIGYHPIQKRLADLNGTQCGYCSPGMIMNMYGLIESKNEKLTMEEIENSFGGSLCRCTGYRPILDAMKSFATDYIDIEYPNEDIDDIEDFSEKICINSQKKCKKENCQMKNENYKCNQLKQIIYENYNEWYTVKTIKQIFDIFEKIDDKNYMLVAGNTAHGVFRRSNDIKVFIDVNNVQELHMHKIGDTLELGANLSLTETMEILLEASKTYGFEYCQEIYKHFDLVANVPVRNMGTLAGNLYMKHKNPKFPSDIFICFEAINAKITIQTNQTEYSVLTMKDFINLNAKKIVQKSIMLPKYDSKNYFYNSYKIMPRAQNAHSYINAAFLINIDKEIIVNARICFGGVNAKFVHAEKTENYIQGKNLFTNDTIQKAFEILNEELNTDYILPDALPDYRKLLACGLFYKFILKIVPNDKIQPKYKSGGSILKRELSSGFQTFDTNKDVYPVTKPTPKIEALVQCSGEAFYMNDLPKQPNELYAAFVHATESNVMIASIDPSEALKMPGIVAFYSANDIPGKNSFVDTTFPEYGEEEEIFATNEIKYFAQVIGMIVAETSKQAQNATSKVKILYEKLDKIFLPTLKDVIENKAWDRCFDTGMKSVVNKVSTSNKKATKKIQGNLEIGSQYHFTMEPHVTICIPIEDGMDVYSATQFMDHTKEAIAKTLNVKSNSIYLQVRRLGGGYGAKISRGNQVACACALACHKLNKPIRFVRTLESTMISTGKRYACRSDYEIEINDQGKIIELKNTFLEDAGSTLNENPVEFLALYCAKNCYDSANWILDGKSVKTDAPSHTWCRAPGSVEGIAMIENIMEHIARETNKDSVDIRMENIPKSEKIYTMLPQFIKSIDYMNRKKEIENFNKENRWKKKGLGITVMKYPIEYFGIHTALVSIYHGDGTVSVSHGGIEMGQGIHTKVAQVAAYVFGIPLEMIRVHPSDTFSGANSTVTGGTIGSESVCYATRKACETLVNRIKPIKETVNNAKWSDVIKKCWDLNILLTASEAHKAGDMKTYSVYGVACSEIEIDVLTGNSIINRVDILEDTGESLNPTIDIGQIEGGFVMGIGYWLTEQLIFNRQNGELLTTRTWNYKVPGAKDIPVDFRINLLQKNPNPAGFMRSKATGEPAMCLSISVLFAIRNAIDSARLDAGIKEKWYHLGAPTTPEHIQLACGNSLNDFKLL